MCVSRERWQTQLSRWGNKLRNSVGARSPPRCTTTAFQPRICTSHSLLGRSGSGWRPPGYRNRPPQWQAHRRRHHGHGAQAGHSPWKLSTARLFKSSSLRLMSDSRMGACRQRGGAMGLGSLRTRGQVHWPDSPAAPYLGVLHQAGHGFLGVSTCLGQPEGQREHSPACSARPPVPGCGLAALSPLHRSGGQAGRWLRALTGSGASGSISRQSPAWCSCGRHRTARPRPRRGAGCWPLSCH